MRELLENAAQRAISYLEGLSSRGVAPPTEAVVRLALLNKPLPEQTLQPEAVLELLDEICSPATTAEAGPRFFGFVHGGVYPVTLAANWLAGAWDQNTVYYSVTPATALLEQIALGWLVDLFKLPPGCGGAFVTGATMANFCGLAAARRVVLERAGWSVEADGLFGAPVVSVVTGREAHPSLFKSLGLLGLGRNRVLQVPVDSQGRMKADALPSLSGPTIVCVQAGNVNTGAFDPIAEICDRAHEAGAWVHVDGAFGLWAATAASTAPLAAGITNADSWATDAHKWLNVPYDSGLAFVRDPEALRAAMAITAEYLPTHSPFRNPSDFTPELSRRARGVEVWAALRALGRQGVAELIERTCRHARRFAEGFQQAGYKVLNEVVLNQVLIAFGDEETTKRVIAEIQKEGTCWCGGTVWQGQTAMRISICGWSTTDADVELSLQAMLCLARRHCP
jgi:glutamate/tyrosine decarboxylase-like PLP-dependent enzyme